LKLFEEEREGKPFSRKSFPSHICLIFLLTLILVAENEGLAVGALDHSGILLVRAYTDSLKGTVIALAGVVRTLCYGTLDLTVHVCLIHFSILSKVKIYEITGFHIYCPLI